jgi:hypothetical protein
VGRQAGQSSGTIARARSRCRSASASGVQYEAGAAGAIRFLRVEADELPGAA